MSAVEGTPKPVARSPDNGAARGHPQSHATSFAVPDPALGVAGERDMGRWQYSGESPRAAAVDELNFNSTMPMPISGMGNGNNFPWEMIGLGLEEPLPTQETIDEL
jgi:hypothetical protein